MARAASGRRHERQRWGVDKTEEREEGGKEDRVVRE
jgi:hypothetical protein